MQSTATGLATTADEAWCELYHADRLKSGENTRNGRAHEHTGNPQETDLVMNVMSCPIFLVSEIKIWTADSVQ